MTIVDYLTSLFIKALKMTSNLHENSGTVEYFTGQYNFRLTGPQGKWLKKLSLSPASCDPSLPKLLVEHQCYVGLTVVFWELNYSKTVF